MPHDCYRKTLIIGIDVGSETHYVRIFNWRNYEYSKTPLAFSNDEAGFLTFKTGVEDIKEKHYLYSEIGRNNDNNTCENLTIIQRESWIEI